MQETLNVRNCTSMVHIVRVVKPVVQITLYSVVGTASLSSNILFLYVITCTDKMKAQHTSLLINLALSDVVIILVGLPLTLVNLMCEKPVTEGILCQGQGFVLLLLFLHSNFNLTHIAIQRYLIIVKSKLYPKFVTKTRMIFRVISTWICAIIVSLPSLLGWGKVDYNFGRAHCMLVWGHSISYLLFVQFLAFTLPLLIITFCYYNIINYSKTSYNKSKRNCDIINTSRKQREYRLTMALILVVINFFILFIPYAILIYWEGFANEIVSEEFSFVSMLLAYSSSMTDFWIYSYMNMKCCNVIIDFICRKVFPFRHGNHSSVASAENINNISLS